MYAAAGGASLASRQARRIKQRQHQTPENVHQQFYKRFQQLQHQHAPACADGYNYLRSSSGALLSPSQLRSCVEFSIPESLEGKAAVAWLEKDRKGALSPLGEVPTHFPAAHHHRLKSTDVQRKWYRKSKIHGSSFTGSSSEDIRGGLNKQYDGAANMLLYVGLCAIALGLVIAFVGTGEKGFKTVELRLIGPSIVGFGFFCCSLRIFFCFCPTKYMRKKFKHRHKRKNDPAEELDIRSRQALEYYKHLPFRNPMAANLLLFDSATSSSNGSVLKQQHPIIVPTAIATKANSGVAAAMTDNRKRVLIAPASSSGLVRATQQQNDYDNEDAISDTLSTLRELSPLREEDLIDFQHMAGVSGNSYENLQSLFSSLDYLNDRPGDEDIDNRKSFSFANGATAFLPHLTSEERLSRLKSTLTFGDSNEQFIDTRLMISYDEFDDLRDDAIPPVPQSSGSYVKQESTNIAAATATATSTATDTTTLPMSSELVLSAGSLKINNDV